MRELMQTDSKLAIAFSHSFRPCKGGAAYVVLAFSILLAVSAKSLFGLPLGLILISWFFKYSFILFDNTMRGFDEPPVLDINMMNPVGELRPLVALTIVGGMAALTWAAYEAGHGILALAVGTTFLVLLPACIAVLGLEGNPLQAVNPLAWLRMVHGLGTYYWIVLALIAAEFAAIFFLGQLPLGLVFQFAAGMFGMLSAFSLLAGSIYERRDDLGVVAWDSPERREEKQRKEDHRQDERVITEAYGLVRATRHQDGWKMLQAWLDAHAFSSDSYRWLVEQTDRWEDPRYSMRLAQDWIERLMAHKQTGQGLAVVVARLQNDPTFRPKSAADTLSLAQLAARGGGSPRTARALLSDFAERFPGDARITIARDLAQHLS